MIFRPLSKLLFTLLLLSFLPFMLIAQEPITLKNAPKSTLKLYNKSEKCIQERNYDKAITFLHKAIKKEPLFIDAYLKIAGLSYEADRFDNAIEYFEKALSIDESYDPRMYQALYLSYEKQKSFTKAIINLEEYINRTSLEGEELEKANRALSILEFRENALRNPISYKSSKLGSFINTEEYSEYWPSLTADQNTMFFTRKTKNQEDLYYIERNQDGEWKNGMIMPNLNTYENEGAHSSSADGSTIVFTFCSDGRNNKARGCNIYISNKRNGKWEVPQYMREINSSAWDAQPNLSANGKTIIFSSRRKGGLGKTDLWISKKNSLNIWSDPENLSELINTPGNEEAPFLHPDGKTLYFMSNYHAGMGSYDIFYSRLNNEGKWTQPQNLGYPINTEDHEGAMIVSMDGKTAYFSKGPENKDAKKRNLDIYSFELPEHAKASPVGFVKIYVKDAVEKYPITARLNIQQQNDLEAIKDSLDTNSEGFVLIPLPLGSNYSVNVKKQGYIFKSKRFELLDMNLAKNAFEIEIFLDKIKDIETVIVEPTVLENVLFETGSFELLEESYFELENLYELLNQNSNMEIEIHGHTDNVGEAENNRILSENRAKAVYHFLTQKGISEGRISYKGFGESKPVASNDTEEGRKLNRRTEFIITN